MPNKHAVLSDISQLKASQISESTAAKFWLVNSITQDTMQRTNEISSQLHSNIWLVDRFTQHAVQTASDNNSISWWIELKL